MRIAVCDNLLHDCEQLAKWIEQYCALYEFVCEIGIFRSPELLYEAVAVHRFDIMFIGFSEPDGFLTARRMREMDKFARIVYISDTADYAIRGVRLHFLDYIVRPVSFQHVVRAFSFLPDRGCM